MNKNLLPLIVGGAVLFVLFTSLKGNSSNKSGAFDLSSLADRYGNDAVNALNRLYGALLRATDPNTGQPLNTSQMQFMLAQALLESGLFTDSANWNNINHNNFSGIKAHGSYSAIPGSSLGYANYGSIDDFAEDWLNVLSYNNEPIEASSLVDYNNRLKANNYYESDKNAYLNNLAVYYGLIGDTI